MEAKGINRSIRDKIDSIHLAINYIESVLDGVLIAISIGSKLPVVRNVISKIRNVMTAIENILVEIKDVKRILAQNLPDSSGSNDGRAFRPLKQIYRIEIRSGELGSAQVSINGLMPFGLSQTLAALLDILAKDEGITGPQNGNDPLVPFKTVDMITSSMPRAHGGKKYTERALTQGIHRLRRTLTDYGFDGLIETNRRVKAYRLALRRKDTRYADEDSGYTQRS